MKTKLIVTVVLFFALFFRFYQLGSIPHGLSWDEAAVGYNGFALFANKTDEWLQEWPVSFKSFGDYKAPLAIYLNGLSTFLFGLNIWAVRLPFAIAGMLSVVTFYILLRTLYSENPHREFLSILGLILISFSPWHIHFSRVAFESGLSLLFLLVSLTCFIKFTHIQNENFTKMRKLLLPFAAVTAGMSVYAYHSAKVTLPMLGLATAFLFLRKSGLMKQWKVIAASFLLGILVLQPLLSDSLYGSGATRASVLIFSENLPLIESLKIISSNFVQIFSPSFLIGGKTDTLRHGTGSWGILFPTTFVLCLFGVWYVVRTIRNKNYGSSYKITLFSLLLLFFGVLPAIITREPTHPNRTLLALPGFLLLAVQGAEFLILEIQRRFSFQETRNTLYKMTVGTCICLYSLTFISYWNNYLSDYSKKSTEAFQDGYIEVFQVAQEYEKGKNGKPVIEKILFSNEYGQPYIFALFVRKTHPIWYQAGSLEKYEFTDTITSADLERKATLVVATKNNLLDLAAAEHVVYGSDGSIRFAIYLSKGTE